MDAIKIFKTLLLILIVCLFSCSKFHHNAISKHRSLSFCNPKTIAKYSIQWENKNSDGAAGLYLKLIQIGRAHV